MRGDPSSYESLESLVERMLTGDDYLRLLAWSEAMRMGCGGATLIDDACSEGDGHLGLTIAGLRRHLRRMDSDAQVRARGGRRVHTTANVRLAGLDEVTRGPALARGGRRG